MKFHTSIWNSPGWSVVRLKISKFFDYDFTKSWITHNIFHQCRNRCYSTLRKIFRSEFWFTNFELGRIWFFIKKTQLWQFCELFLDFFGSNTCTLIVSTYERWHRETALDLLLSHLSLMRELRVQRSLRMPKLIWVVADHRQLNLAI